MHLHEGCARMVGANGRIDDVAIAIGCAGADLLGIGLRIAHGHTKPEGRMELEVEGLPRFGHSVRFWRRVARELERPPIVVTRTSYVGVEEVRRLVMPNVCIAREGTRGVGYLCAE